MQTLDAKIAKSWGIDNSWKHHLTFENCTRWHDDPRILGNCIERSSHCRETNDNLVVGSVISWLSKTDSSSSFLLIVATIVFTTCLNTASAIRYTLHQLFFVCTRGVKENINCQDFDLSLRLRFVTPEKKVKLDSFYLISAIFPNHFRGKKIQCLTHSRLEIKVLLYMSKMKAWLKFDPECSLTIF